MDEALKLAQEAAAQGEVPVGAVIMLNGKVVGRGLNQREKNQDPCGHAEILAIREAADYLKSWRLAGAELFVTLEPCPMCLGAIQQARISRVFYGAKDPKGGALSHGYLFHENEKLNHRFEVVYQETPEASQVLSEFFRLRRLEKKASLG